MSEPAESERSTPDWVRHYLALGVDVVPLEPHGTAATADAIGSLEDLAKHFGGGLRSNGVGLLCGEKLVAVVVRQTGFDLIQPLTERGYLPDFSDVGGGDGARVWLFRAEPGEILPNIELLPGVMLIGSGVVPAPPTTISASAIPLFWRKGHSIEQCLRTALPAGMVQAALDPEQRKQLRSDLLGSSIATPSQAETGLQTVPAANSQGTPPPPTPTPVTATLVGWDGPSFDGKPAIEVIADEEEMGSESLRILSMTRNDIFKRADVIVAVSEDTDKLSGVTRPRKLPKIREITRERIRGLLSSEIAFFKWKKLPSGETFKVAVPVPEALPGNIISRLQIEHLKQIESVTETPTLRPDGSVVETPGYDETTGVLYRPKRSFPKVPERPSRLEATRAYGRLADLFCDFPFAEPHHKAMVVAALLTPLARPAFGGHAPMFFIESNVRGTGKTLIVDVIHTLLYGNDAPRRVISIDDEEMRKKITTIGMEGRPIVLFDNVRCKLDSPSLEAALTTASWADRALGSNKDVDVVLTCVWFGTGNNVEYAGDISRRIARIRVLSDEERPESRKAFKYPDLLTHVKDCRGELVVDALTILRAYVTAGKPDQGLDGWGGFVGWSSLVRSAVAWASGLDPYKATETTEMDPEAMAISALLAAWERITGKLGDGGPKSVKTVLEYVAKSQYDATVTREDKHDDFQEAVYALIGIQPKDYLSVGVKRVGKLLAKSKDRVRDGKRFVAKPNRNGISEWAVEYVGGITPEPKSIIDGDEYTDENQ